MLLQGCLEERFDSAGLVGCAGLAPGELAVRALDARDLTSVMPLSCLRWQPASNAFEQTGCPTALLLQEIQSCVCMAVEGW